MEAFAVHGVSRNESIALLVENRHKPVQGIVVVFALVHVCIMTERRCNGFGLVAPFAGAKGTEIHFDQAENVGVQCFEKMNQAFEIAVRTAQVTGARNGEMEMSTGASRISDIVKDESHAVFKRERIHTGADRLHVASELTEREYIRIQAGV